MHRIALISTNKFKFSETFIQKHCGLLPFEVHYLYGGYLPNYFGNDEQFLFGIENPEQEVERHKEMKWQLQEAISEYLKEQNIKAVLTEYGISGVEMMDICEALQIPLIVHFHGYDAYRSDIMQDYGARYPELFQKASKVIVVSKHMQQRLMNLGCAESKIVYTPCGADEKLFQPCDAGKNPPVFLYTGRFDETKGPHLAILAFSELHKVHAQAKFVMIGDGHLLESCKILAKSLNVADAIEFKGALPQTEVAAYMQRVRAFVQHSVTTSMNDTEGTPVAVLEAGLSGLPVVSTLHGGIQDVVVHGETGFLVEEGDYKFMAEYMAKLASDSSLATQMGMKAHQRIKEQYTLAQHIKTLADAIISCIAQLQKVQSS